MADYHRMAECGILREGERVELLQGQIIPMTPIGPRHTGCVRRLIGLLSPLIAGNAVLDVQDPLILDDHSEPQPDVTLLKPDAELYGRRTPATNDALLIIEVAESSVDYDRDVKIPAYARAGVPEAWLVVLPSDAIEVHRDPSPKGYRDIRRATRGDVLSILGLPGIELQVNDILG